MISSETVSEILHTTLKARNLNIDATQEKAIIDAVQFSMKVAEQRAMVTTLEFWITKYERERDNAGAT